MNHHARDVTARQGVDETRRRVVLGASALSLLAGTVSVVRSGKARATVRTGAHIVIAGSGLGGIAVASRLARELDGATITIVDRKEVHNYQPGYTLVATGIAVDYFSD